LRFDPLLLTRLQIERVPLDLFDDVFVEHLPLEPPKRAVERLPVMNMNFSQDLIPSSCGRWCPAPSLSNATRNWRTVRTPPLQQCIGRSFAFAGVPDHVALCEVDRFDLRASLQKASAQERQILKRDSIPPNQIEIRRHLDLLPFSIFGNNVEIILSHVIELSKAR